MILASNSTENGRAELLDVTREVWRGMHEQGPTEDEVANAKRYLTGSFTLRLDSTSRIARTSFRSSTTGWASTTSTSAMR